MYWDNLKNTSKYLTRLVPIVDIIGIFLFTTEIELAIPQLSPSVLINDFNFKSIINCIYGFILIYILLHSNFNFYMHICV
jgi:hypothetical protein